MIVLFISYIFSFSSLLSFPCSSYLLYCVLFLFFLVYLCRLCLKLRTEKMRVMPVMRVMMRIMVNGICLFVCQLYDDDGRWGMEASFGFRISRREKRRHRRLTILRLPLFFYCRRALFLWDCLLS
ncbi:hypothetical protein EX30DRAFT_172387 [Ascodesmis nigricans]|uniref:Uncharacterized protein n=1 Tax=Ascodesmis nigricans TaxID=341454 RepID=A0A4S2MLL2_9PEZI|nr:hypothetical protein EX30DRAFT_172387 [Ascodesmis nigricans]